MAIIKIKRGSGVPSGLTYAELAFDATNKRLYIGVTGGSELLTSPQGGVSSINGLTGAITNVARTNVNNSFTASQSISASNASLTVQDTSSLNEVAFDGSSNRLYFYNDLSSGEVFLQPTIAPASTITVSLPDYTTTLAGLAGTQTFTGTNTFNTLTNFPGGMSGAATRINTTETSINGHYYPVFVTSSTSGIPRVDTVSPSVRMNPSTGQLTCKILRVSSDPTSGTAVTIGDDGEIVSTSGNYTLDTQGSGGVISVGDVNDFLNGTKLVLIDDNLSGDPFIKIQTIGDVFIGDYDSILNGNYLNVSPITGTNGLVETGMDVKFNKSMSVGLGISAAGGVTFSGNVATISTSSTTGLASFAGGISAAGGVTFSGNVAMISTSSTTGLASFAGGISAAGGVTFNTSIQSTRLSRVSSSVFEAKSANWTPTDADDGKIFTVAIGGKSTITCSLTGLSPGVHFKILVITGNVTFSVTGTGNGPAISFGRSAGDSTTIYCTASNEYFGTISA